MTSTLNFCFLALCSLYYVSAELSRVLEGPRNSGLLPRPKFCQNGASSYYDGCNWCSCDGMICTKRYCSVRTEIRLPGIFTGFETRLQRVRRSARFAQNSRIPDLIVRDHRCENGQSSYYDGCNWCSCDNRVCTLRWCGIKMAPSRKRRSVNDKTASEETNQITKHETKINENDAITNSIEIPIEDENNDNTRTKRSAAARVARCRPGQQTYYDGCNTCTCDGMACTRKRCNFELRTYRPRTRRSAAVDNPEEIPFSQGWGAQPIFRRRINLCRPGQTSYYDGCNYCSCDGMACTRMACNKKRVARSAEKFMPESEEVFPSEMDVDTAEKALKVLDEAVKSEENIRLKRSAYGSLPRWVAWKYITGKKDNKEDSRDSNTQENETVVS